MAKEKVTLTLERRHLQELRSLASPRSLSAAVDAAVASHVQRLRHLAAVDEWLAELEREHGPAPPETLEWAARLVEAFTVAVADLAGGAVVATTDTDDLERLAGGSPAVLIADIG
jgi:hypothetical protein